MKYCFADLYPPRFKDAAAAKLANARVSLSNFLKGAHVAAVAHTSAWNKIIASKNFAAPTCQESVPGFDSHLCIPGVSSWHPVQGLIHLSGQKMQSWLSSWIPASALRKVPLLRT